MDNELKTYAEYLKSGDPLKITEFSVNKILDNRYKTITIVPNYSELHSLVYENDFAYNKANVHWIDEVSECYELYYFIYNLNDTDIKKLNYPFASNTMITIDISNDMCISKFRKILSTLTNVDNLTTKSIEWRPLGMISNMALKSHLNS